MRYYFIAGEASGDLHGSNLIKHLKQIDHNAVMRGWGGDRMQQQGMLLAKHYNELAFMGFWEVAGNIRTILRNFSFAEKDIVQFNPDVIILIDYPGFNLRLAKFLKKKNIRVFYYISPQVWAWNVSRVKQIKQTVSRMLVTLPFEKQFYAKYGIDVDFVGHPLLDAIDETAKDDTFLQKHHLHEKKIIALLPGSRKQEIAKILPVMMQVCTHFPDYHFVVAGLSYLGSNYYEQFLTHPHVKLVMDETYSLLHQAHAALVASGTATLETALLDVPQAVCYKGNYFSYLIGKMLVQVPFISLVNLIAEKKVVDELIQDKCNEKQLSHALQKLFNEDYRTQILADYQMLKSKLGGTGASERAAKLIYSYLTEK